MVKRVTDTLVRSKRKALLSLILTALLALALVGCGSNSTDSTAATENTAASTESAESRGVDDALIGNTAPTTMPSTKMWVSVKEVPTEDYPSAAYAAGEGNVREVLLISLIEYPMEEERNPSVYVFQGVLFSSFGERESLKGVGTTTLFAEDVEITDGSFTVESGKVHLEASRYDSRNEPAEDGIFLIGSLTTQNGETIEFTDSRVLGQCHSGDNPLGDDHVVSCPNCSGVGYLDGEPCEQCSGRGCLYRLEFNMLTSFLI